MDLLKTPSIQSLLDSDIESVASLQSFDIEELDETEYALPQSEAPTLAEVLNADDDDDDSDISFLSKRKVQEPVECAALQVDVLQAVSQQLIHAQERTSAGAATSLSVGIHGRLTVGTAHGRVLSFQDQILRWVCDSNSDRGAVSCLAYNHDGTRLLAGYARSLVCQYDSAQGVILRRVVLGGEIWGVLQVNWAGSTGVALDTGGSVWLVKFSRPLGVRSARTSCLFSGARGEVVTMAARDARVLALATLSRVIVVAGGRAAGVRLHGPPDTLPVVTWSNNNERTLICARSTVMQWIQVMIDGVNILLRVVQRVELKSSPLWLGWLGDSLAIFDCNETLYLYGNITDKPIDLSNIEPVYASAFFKGLWTDGRVSRAMCAAGVSALGGVAVLDGALVLLGRSAVVRVQERDILARAQALFSSDRKIQAINLLCSVQAAKAQTMANDFISYLAERPNLLTDKELAKKVIKLCVTYNLSYELWNLLWEQCSSEDSFVEAIADTIARGEVDHIPPSPDLTQALIERLAEFAPELVERVVSSLPLTAIDPHRASVFARDNKLWRAVGAVAASLGGSSGAMRELCDHMGQCPQGSHEAGQCAGDALLLTAADGLAGRGAGGRPLPDHARPSARHDALQALLMPLGDNRDPPLRMLLRHDARALARLLEQSARDPPFVGPLGKQNRLRVARALLTWTDELQSDDKVEILEFVAGQLRSGALPADRELVSSVQQLAAGTACVRADRAWLELLQRPHTRLDLDGQLPAATNRPRVAWRIHCLQNNRSSAVQEFLNIPDPTERDLDDFFEYFHKVLDNDETKIQIEEFLPAITELRPRAAAVVLTERWSDVLPSVLRSVSDEASMQCAEMLLERGLLKGDAALGYLRRLCAHRPGDVLAFLESHPGTVQPEDALNTVRELGPAAAVPHCLEAAGDPEGALAAIIALLRAAGDRDEQALVRRAHRLCAAVAPTVPATTAAAMWGSLLAAVDGAAPALLLDATRYVSPVTLLSSRRPPGVATLRALLHVANARRTTWQCAARLADRELHEALARAIRASSAALCSRNARCPECSSPLYTEASRACCCGVAVHASCARDDRCPSCRLSPPLVGPAPRLPPPAPAPAPPLLHELSLVAPPRPDLEGIA